MPPAIGDHDLCIPCHRNGHDPHDKVPQKDGRVAREGVSSELAASVQRIKRLTRSVTLAE